MQVPRSCQYLNFVSVLYNDLWREIGFTGEQQTHCEVSTLRNFGFSIGIISAFLNSKAGYLFV